MSRVISSHNPWLRITQPKPQARLRLFCFPYAGAAASIYRIWPQHLSAEIEVCAVQLPGRENRLSERPFTNIPELVRALRPSLLPYLDKPFALFGHSMGALIAYELAQQLYQQRGPLPTHLLVSGRHAPLSLEPEAPLHALPSDAVFLAEWQRRYLDLPAVIFANPEFQKLFTALLRADMMLAETYQSLDKTALPCPIIAFGGVNDPYASWDKLRTWQALTNADFMWHCFPGNHLYLNEQVQPLLATITGYLTGQAVQNQVR